MQNFSHKEPLSLSSEFHFGSDKHFTSIISYAYLNHIDHQFYHKWALLTDPEDFISGPKGYLKCDIGIIGKGDTVKVPQKSEKDPDDIEALVLFKPKYSLI